MKNLEKLIKRCCKMRAGGRKLSSGHSLNSGMNLSFNRASSVTPKSEPRLTLPATQANRATNKHGTYAAKYPTCPRGRTPIAKDKTIDPWTGSVQPSTSTRHAAWTCTGRCVTVTITIILLCNTFNTGITFVGCLQHTRNTEHQR